MNEEELKLAIKSAFDDSGFKAANAEMRKIEDSSSSMGGKIAKGFGIATLAAGALAVGIVGIGSAAMSITAGNAQFERYNVQLATLLGSAEAAKDRMAELSEFGAKTPFELPQLVEAEKVLVGFGLNTEKTTKLAGMNLADFRTVIGDVAAGTGRDFAEVALTFGKFSAGATGESLARLQEMGVVTKEQLAAVGIEFSKSGQLLSPLPEAFAAATKIAADKFGGGMDALSGTFEGQMSTLADTWGQIKRTLAAPIFDALKSGLNDFLPALGQFTVGFDAAKANGLDPFRSALAGVTATLKALGIEDAEAKVKAFGDMVVNVAAFVRDDLWPALQNLGATVVSVGKFLLDHKGTIIAVAVAYGTLKTAMAINKAVESASDAISAAKAAWIAYRAGTQGATLATTSFGTALKLALGPIGWIAIAVGALYVAWKTNFGGIQEKTAAVVNWIKGVPAMVEAAWGQVKLGLALLVTDFKAKFAAIPDGVRTAFKVLLMILFPLPMLFTKTGRDMVAGLWNGLKAGWDAMVGWVTGKAKALASGVKKVLGISSPSRVFYEIGSWIMEGWALGMAAGGVWVVRTARQVMDDTLAEFHAADAAAVAGGVVAAMAKAAVDAALAADGVIKGKRESASEAWGRHYDELMRREDEHNAAVLADIEARRKVERDAAEGKRDDFIEIAEIEKRHFEWLKSQQEQEAARGGKPVSPKLEDFGLEVERVDAAFKDIFALLGDEDLADFWKRWNDDVNANITTTEDLGKAIDAILSEIGKAYEQVFEDIETKYDGQAKSEEDRHKRALEQINERKALIDALIQAQADADADLADLIAARDALLRQAREAIAAAQKAAETAEDRIHAGVMANIAEARKAEERAHKGRLIHFEDERKAIDAAHERRMTQLQAQRDKITAGFTERQRQIEKDRTALSQLKLDLGVEDALIKLTGLEQKLNDLQAIMDSFKVVSRGREALDEQRRAITDRVKITTDAQRKALQDVLDSGTLNAKDQRRVELLLLGRGTQKAEDVRRILGAGADVLKGEIAAAQMIVDYNTQQVAIRERLIEQAETQLRIDQENAQVQIDALDKRIAAEDERYKKESANLAARMTAEQQAFDDTMAWYDAISDAEDERHAKRMGDIAAEYALELAKLGMTQSEIDAMVAAARSESERIARETEETWKRIRDAMGLPGVGAVGGGTSTPTQPIPIIGGGGEIRGLRPQGGGAVEGVTITGEVSAKDATIQNVEFGGLTMNTALTFRIGAKDIAAEIVDAVIGDTALVDKLGARINARTGPRIGGSTP